MKVKKLLKAFKCCRFSCSIRIYHTDEFGNVGDNDYCYPYRDNKEKDKIYRQQKVEVWDLVRGQDNINNTLKIWVRKPKEISEKWG